MFLRAGSFVDRFPDELICTTTADIILHPVVNILIGGLGYALEKRSGIHDLTRLTVAALRYVELDPCFLEWVGIVGAETFDGRDALSF